MLIGDFLSSLLPDPVDRSIRLSVGRTNSERLMQHSNGPVNVGQHVLLLDLRIGECISCFL